MSFFGYHNCAGKSEGFAELDLVTKEDLVGLLPDMKSCVLPCERRSIILSYMHPSGNCLGALCPLRANDNYTGYRYWKYLPWDS